MFPDGDRVGKDLVILLFECVVGKMFCYVFMDLLSHIKSMLGLKIELHLFLVNSILILHNTYNVSNATRDLVEKK